MPPQFSCWRGPKLQQQKLCFAQRSKDCIFVCSIIFISKKTDVHTTNLSSANAAITNHSQKDREWADTRYIYLVSIENHLSSWWIRVCTGIWLQGFSFPFTESLWPHISFFPALCRAMMLEQATSSHGQGYFLQPPDKQPGCMFPVVLLTNLLHHEWKTIAFQ